MLTFYWSTFFRTGQNKKEAPDISGALFILAEI